MTGVAALATTQAAELGLNRRGSAMKRAWGAAAIVAAAGCAPAPTPLPDRVALSCVVERQFVAAGATQLIDDTSRTLWIDTARGLYAISEFGSEAVDPDWAAAFAEARTANAGLAPVARQTGSFVCLVAGEDQVCRHGVDLARGDYAFDTLAAGPVSDGPQTSARMIGTGRCSPAPDLGWPTL